MDVSPGAAKRIAILQSSYIPWKGYFDIINSVDEFILYDDAQYSRGDWRNRNRIKTPAGLKWLTIPVRVKGRYTQNVGETEVNRADWARRHWRSIEVNYARAAHFPDHREEIERLYLGCEETHLSRINFRFLSGICEILGIRTPLRWSSEFAFAGNPTEKLVSICRQAGAGVYLTGPAARAYLDEPAFAEAGIRVEWMNYDGYPPYRQLHGEFEHRVSVIDLILNEGPRARSFMKSFVPAPA